MQEASHASAKGARHRDLAHLTCEKDWPGWIYKLKAWTVRESLTHILTAPPPSVTGPTSIQVPTTVLRPVTDNNGWDYYDGDGNVR
jgi:hypothetical protein